jgi:NAD-dependent SIR2 family protein deacetylase
LQCRNCYEVYPWKAQDWAKNPPICPKCKSTLSDILRDFSDIREKPPKKPEAEAEGGEEDEKEEGVHPD